MTKALFLSALIFPGAGQFYLKRFKTGIILLSTIAVCFFIMVTSIMSTAMSAVQQIQMQGGIVDMQKITQVATETTENASNVGFNFALVLIVVCWFYSIIDAYLACKKINHKAK